ncbi:MAG: SDR family NAD(P)-dependent oxidoreductase, partial [Bacteroidota bacterium]
ESNPLLEKLIEYQKDRLAGKDMGDLADENFNPHLNRVVQEVLEEEEEAPISSKEDASIPDEMQYDIIDSIFEDEEEEDEDADELATMEEEELVSDAITVSVLPSSSETPGSSSEEEVDWEAYLLHAQQLFDQGETVKGLEWLKKGLEKDPENITLRYVYANQLIETTHEYEIATQHLEHIVAVVPDHTDAYLVLANLAEKRRDFLLAKSYYEKIVSINPGQAEVYFKLGMIVSNHFEHQKSLAAKYLKKSLRLDQSNPDVHYHYALLQLDHLDNEKKAISHLKKTLDLQKKHSFANYDLALIYHSRQKQKKASKYYRKAYKINPELRTDENDLAFGLIKPTDHLSPPKMANGNTPNSLLENEVELDIDLSTAELEENTFPNDVLEELEEEEIEVALEEAIASETTLPVETKIVLITGATSGIGRATAELFARKGYRLILTGRRNNRLEILKKSFEHQYQSEVKILSFDVRDVATVKAAIEHLPEAWRAVDVLINNAGLAKGYAPIHEGEISHWETMIDTNIKGLLYLTRAISPYMVKRRSGHIINLSSSAGKEVYPNGNVYCATKHAVEALTKAMRIELHPYNIRVSQVSPGHVEETEFAFVRYEDAEKAQIYQDFQPLKASDVAETIHFIVSRPAYVNIQDIVLFGTQQASNLFIDRSGRQEED